MPNKQYIIGFDGEIGRKGLKNDVNYCSEKYSKGNSIANSFSCTATKQKKTKSYSAIDFESKKNRALKNVSFDIERNEYFEPKQNSTDQWVCPAECLKTRRNAVSMIKRDSYEALRILSMYTSWRLAQARKGRKYEQFADFLARASPKLFDKFFVDCELLL